MLGEEVEIDGGQVDLVVELLAADHRGQVAQVDGQLLQRLGRRRCPPCPAGQVLESPLAVGVKDALGVVDVLLHDPYTNLVAIDRVDFGTRA